MCSPYIRDHSGEKGSTFTQLGPNQGWKRVRYDIIQFGHVYIPNWDQNTTHFHNYLCQIPNNWPLSIQKDVLIDRWSSHCGPKLGYNLGPIYPPLNVTICEITKNPQTDWE